MGGGPGPFPSREPPKVSTFSLGSSGASVVDPWSWGVGLWGFGLTGRLMHFELQVKPGKGSGKARIRKTRLTKSVEEVAAHSPSKQRRSTGESVGQCCWDRRSDGLSHSPGLEFRVSGLGSIRRVSRFTV